MSGPSLPTQAARNAYYLRVMAVAIRNARMELRELPPGQAETLAGWQETAQRWAAGSE